jgi:catechol 2,3-dioxygenase-like lactoylglutathione lyase family enzyme
MAVLFHVGLTVRDLEASLAFYRDVVGFDVTERLHRRSAAFDRLMGHEASTEVKVAYLDLSGFTLQLIEYVSGSGPALELGHDKAGNPHFCFYVDDAAATRSALEQRGDVEITSGLTQVSPTMLSFYVNDPDGVPVEFLESTAPVEDWTGSVDV